MIRWTRSRWRHERWPLPELRDVVEDVRAKNAGPFWVTIDIFCGTPEVYRRVLRGLATETVARLFRTSSNRVKRFDIADLNVVKFSIPRPVVQGMVHDRDMHGAAWAQLIAELELP